ncbi:pyoverdine biosynthesis protein PvdN [Nitrospira sp.]|nr:pyoverdine biosynthesis protein PvdN [Nitrospira sp.]
MDMERRQFLVRTGLLLGAGVLAAHSSGCQTPEEVRRRAYPYEDWTAVRNAFELDRRKIHMAGFLLASHPTPVREAIERHRRALDDDPASYWGENEERAEAAVLGEAADYLGVSRTEIALTDSTTMGLGLLYGGIRLGQGEEILSTIHDHYSTEMSLRHRAERTGASFRQIPLYKDLSTVSQAEIVQTLVTAIRPETRYVAVTWVHSSTGLKLPIRSIARALATLNSSRPEAKRLLLCVDGVHGLGVENVALSDLGCDFFVAGTHKWMFGPRGTGLVWGTREAWPRAEPTIPTFDAEAYRMWMKLIPQAPIRKAAQMTPGGFHSFEHRWALNEAFKFHKAMGKAQVTERIYALNQQMKQGLAKMPHVTLHTPMSQDLSAGIICFEVAGKSPKQVVEELKGARIIASVTPYGTQYARVAPSLLNTPGEVDEVLRVIRDLRV